MEAQILTGGNGDGTVGGGGHAAGRDDYPVSTLQASFFFSPIGDDLGRHGRDPAQHRRRAGARSTEGAEACLSCRARAGTRTVRVGARRPAGDAQPAGARPTWCRSRSPARRGRHAGHRRRPQAEDDPARLQRLANIEAGPAGHACSSTTTTTPTGRRCGGCGSGVGRTVVGGGDGGRRRGRRPGRPVPAVRRAPPGRSGHRRSRSPAGRRGRAPPARRSDPVALASIGHVRRRVTLRKAPPRTFAVVAAAADDRHSVPWSARGPGHRGRRRRLRVLAARAGAGLRRCQRRRGRSPRGTPQLPAGRLRRPQRDRRRLRRDDRAAIRRRRARSLRPGHQSGVHGLAAQRPVGRAARRRS